jgi:gluconate 2-dehydrogenase gamma chain
MDDAQERGLSRRELLRRAGVAGVASAGSAALFAGSAPAAPQSAQVLRAIEALTTHEFETLSAFSARLFPSDSSGPGANEAHAANYIDRALNSHYSYQKDTYTANLAALDAYSTATAGAAFSALPAARQDAILTALDTNVAPRSFGFTPDAATFFNLVLSHTQEGMFSDPYYGGNANFAGWDLLGFPGVQLAYSAADQRIDVKIDKPHRSTYGYSAFNGRKQ